MTEGESNMNLENPIINQEAERFNYQEEIKKLHATVKKRFKQDPGATYEGELINGIRAKNITISKLNTRRTSYKDRYGVYVDDFNLLLNVCKIRKKDLFKSAYGFWVEENEYNSVYFRNQNQGLPPFVTFETPEGLGKLLDNISQWKK